MEIAGVLKGVPSIPDLTWRHPEPEDIWLNYSSIDYRAAGAYPEKGNEAGKGLEHKSDKNR